MKLKYGARWAARADQLPPMARYPAGQMVKTRTRSIGQRSTSAKKRLDSSSKRSRRADV